MLFVVHYSLSTFLIYNAVTTLDMTSQLKYAAAECNTVKYLKLGELELIFSTLCQVCGFVTVVAKILQRKIFISSSYANAKTQIKYSIIS